MPINTNQIKQTFVKLAKRLVDSKLSQPDRSLALPESFGAPFLIRAHIALSGEDASAYFDALDSIVAVVAEEETWSRSSIDLILTDCLNSVLQNRPHGPSNPIKEQANRLIEGFKQPPGKWMVALHVSGMDQSCAEISFGRLRFATAGLEIPSGAHVFPSHLPKGEHVYAYLEVEAIDRHSAVARAKTSLREHLAILNALCSSGVPSHFRLTHEPETAPIYSLFSVAPIGEPLPPIAFDAVHSRIPLTRSDLEKALADRNGEEISRALRSKPSEFWDRLLSGYVLAGEASVEPASERSFLLFAIALESVLLGKNTKTELGYQLGLRVAHLVSGNIEGRRDAAKHIQNLYDRRSRIVHAGETEVPESDLSIVRLFCLSCLHKLAGSAVTITNVALERWFKDRMLGANENLAQHIGTPV